MRVTTVNDLFNAGLSETDIVKRTRHRSVATLKTYRRDNVASTIKASEALSAPTTAVLRNI